MIAAGTACPRLYVLVGLATVLAASLTLYYHQFAHNAYRTVNTTVFTYHATHLSNPYIRTTQCTLAVLPIIPAAEGEVAHFRRTCNSKYWRCIAVLLRGRDPPLSPTSC